MMLIFFVGPGVDGGGTVLDGVVGPTINLFAVGFFDTSSFHFLITACEASEPGMEWGAYDTPIYSRTRFKQPPFGMFATLRASYSFCRKLPNTLSASIFISAKTRLACFVATFSTASNGKGVSTFNVGIMPRATFLKPQPADLAHNILLDSIMTSDSSSCPNEGSTIAIIVEALYFEFYDIIQLAHPQVQGMHAFSAFGASPIGHLAVKPRFHPSSYTFVLNCEAKL
jgi:hypothetical protein